MAPEQCMSAGDVDEKADVYALGVMLYERLRPVRSSPARFPRGMPGLEARSDESGNGVDRGVRARLQASSCGRAPQPSEVW
jgi:serine/threonine protein kinase